VWEDLCRGIRKKQSGVQSDAITRDYFESLLIELRYLDSVEPDTSMTLFGASPSNAGDDRRAVHQSGRSAEYPTA
jgi:hypothetical protein